MDIYVLFGVSDVPEAADLLPQGQLAVLRGTTHAHVVGARADDGADDARSVALVLVDGPPVSSGKRSLVG